MINAGMWVATGSYIYTFAAYWYAGKNPQAVMMFGYILANFGIIWSIK